MRGTFMVLAFATLAIGCASDGESSSSAFTLPVICDSCDGFSAERTVQDLDIVHAEEGADAAEITLGWSPAADEEMVAEYWVARGEPSATEVNLVTKVPAGASQLTVPLVDDEETYFVVSVDADGQFVGVSAPVRARRGVRTAYRIEDSVATFGETELFAHVWGPLHQGDGASFPVVFMLHGNHGTCRAEGATYDHCAAADSCIDAGNNVVDNAGGYDYLGQTLAAKGFIAVSMSANDFNCQYDHIPERAELILRHIERWKAWGDEPGTFPGDIDVPALADLSQVGLWGHSRGGEAVVHASNYLADRPEFDFIEQVSVLSLAPTDFHAMKAVGVPMLMVLPGCDGDVYTLAGQHIFDRSAMGERSHDLYQAVIPGASHNLFNRQWLENDSNCSGGERMSRGGQEAAISVLTASWFDATFNGSLMPAASQGALTPFPRVDEWAGEQVDARWAYAAADAEVIEDGAEEDVAETNELGGQNLYDDFAEVFAESDGWGQRMRMILQLQWLALNSAPRVVHDIVGVDPSAFAAISFRVAATADESGGDDPFDAAIRLYDEQGTVAQLSLRDVCGLTAQRSNSDQLHVRRTVRISVEDVAAASPEFDWATLNRLEISLAESGFQRGTWDYADVELTR